MTQPDRITSAPASRRSPTVPREPLLAGIDPHHILDWVEDGNAGNIESVRTSSEQTSVTSAGDMA